MPSPDPHDPLPESKFLYRRITTWVVSLIMLGLIWYNVKALHDLDQGPGIVKVTGWLCILLGMVLTYYLVAPSAEQIVKLVQLAKSLRAGVVSMATAAIATPAPPPAPPPPDQPADKPKETEILE